MRLNSLLPPRPFFPLPRPVKNLVRLVTKVVGWRWPRVRRLAKAEPSQRTKAKARKPFLKRRSPSQPSLRAWFRRRRPLILPFPYWSTEKTLPRWRLSLGFFFLSLYFFLWLGQFTPVHDVLFLLLNEKILLFAFVDLCFSCNVCLWFAVVIVLPYAETLNWRCS